MKAGEQSLTQTLAHDGVNMAPTIDDSDDTQDTLVDVVEDDVWKRTQRRIGRDDFFEIFSSIRPA